ncbi:tetratricopeptide repeat protein [Acetobacteraceae bacterium AT-5844]|nr:tetratricopeptide repeat protein [Acetobacteraceae bacterium AT-5844]
MDIMADDTASTLLREANSLRDKGRWLDAADVYAALLLQRPDDAGIMAERAHCLESAGQTEAALRLYREADLLARDGAPALRLGHALLAETPPVLCTLATEGSDWRALPAGLFLRLDQLQRAGTGPADPDWLEALGMLRAAMAGPPLPFAHGTTLLSPGEVWALEEHAPALRRAREVAGLRFIPC